MSLIDETLHTDVENDYTPQDLVPSLGAATLLLDPLVERDLARIVIEGAPGQGKSTIVQYICQIHRSRILNEGADDPRVPTIHRDKPVRLPFKVDCRDFAHWLNRGNPFSSDDAPDVPTDWKKSLESFLAAQITHFSGGSSFVVADLHAVMNLSAVLIVFDGLDEVADIALRREVVDKISKGLNRLGGIAISLQSIVTSRPAAYEDSPGLPEDTFMYLQLTSINRRLIERYAERWVAARKLEGNEATEILEILKDKLDQPHLRELARNPMQLAILLSLIQTKGRSLPDKRTALYDSYVELFFNREAEKSTTVREHRDLLIDIHRYLAWVLHSEAQTKRDRGSVSAERLQQLVKEYLEGEGYDPSLAFRLFTGMVERVVALVSRVEGTYEFEVQPLREYFAARHLYNTAPYSPPGEEHSGTLPERFDALARDFFWQNVTRFYAGCYSKGELPSLCDRLEDLAQSPGYRHTSHPQSLAATLLSDWVFAQNPRSMKQVVSLVVERLALRRIDSGVWRRQRRELLVLPKGSGNEELLEWCFGLLRRDPPFDSVIMLVELVRVNASVGDAQGRWRQEMQAVNASDRTRWITYGLYLGTLANLPNEQLEALVDDERDLAVRLSHIQRSGQTGFIEAQESRFQAVVDDTLANNIVGSGAVRSIADALRETLMPSRYVSAMDERLPIPLHLLWDRRYRWIADAGQLRSVDKLPSFEPARRCQDFVNLGLELSKISAADWATSIAPWDQLVEGGKKLFGNRWAFYVLANASAGIRSKVEKCADASELHDESLGLCRRARHARLRAGTPSWWRSQLVSTSGELDLAFTLLLFWTWAGRTVIKSLGGLADDLLCALPSELWLRFSQAVGFKDFGFPFRQHCSGVRLVDRNL